MCDQRMTKSCYVTALRYDGVVGQVLSDVREDEERREKPTENLVPILKELYFQKL